MEQHAADFARLCREHPVYGKELRYESYKAGQVLRTPGEEIAAFGLVAEGLLRAESGTAEGAELCSAYFQPGDLFPELLWFTGRRAYTYTLIAARRTQVAWLGARRFVEMLEAEPEMTWALLLHLSRRGLKSQLLLDCLNYQTIRERVAYFLAGMHDLSDGEEFLLPASQTVWANTLRVSRASLNQELKRMERQGYFRIQGQRLKVLDLEGLRGLI